MVDDSNQTITQVSDPSAVQPVVPASLDDFADPQALPQDLAGQTDDGLQAPTQTQDPDPLASDPTASFVPTSDPNAPTSDPTVPLAADSTSTTPPQPAKQAGDPQKNPLDVLEQLLNEIDAGKPGSAAAPPEKTGPTPEEIAAEELEKRRIDFEQKLAAQKVIDEQLIAEQRKILTEEMSSGAANVARAQQDEEKKLEKAEKSSADEGYEIIQIDHTKI